MPKATPLELIEQGILEYDWSAVAKGFKALTGKAIKVPKGSPEKKESLTVASASIDDVTAEIKAEIRYPLEKAIKEHCDFLRENDLLKTRAAVLMSLIDAGEDYIQELSRMKKESEEPKDPPMLSDRMQTTKSKNRDKFDIDKFKIQNGEGKTEDGKRYARVEAFKPGMVNNFENDPLKDTCKKPDDEKYLSKVIHQPPRDAPDLSLHEVKCEKCGMMDKVDAFEKAKVTQLDQVYICGNCIRKAVRR